METSTDYASIKTVLKEIKNSEDPNPFTDERIKRIANNRDIKMGIDLYTKTVQETWMIRNGLTVGVVVFLACEPFKSKAIIQVAMWLTVGLVGYCAYRLKFSPPNNLTNKIGYVRKQNLNAYQAIGQGLIKAEFPLEDRQKAYASTIEWCIGEKGSVRDAILYAAVYTICGLKSERVEHLSHACAYVKNQEQFGQLLKLGAKITPANIDKILLKAIKDWNEASLNLVADHYASNNPDEQFISEAVIEALIDLRHADENQALLLAKSLFFGDSKDRSHLIGAIKPSLKASYGTLIINARQLGPASV
ncbi:MAG: hypothetical protein H7A40_00555 [Chlamydiales bacterium]|nr:hypothetical protein [Chlamydiales bacterium]